MASRLPGIFPLLLITLLCVGGVEAFYFCIERYVLTSEQKTPAKEEAVVEKSAVVKSAPIAVDPSIILKRNLFGPPPAEQDDAGMKPAEADEELEATTLEVVLMGTVHGIEGGNRAVILNKKDRKQEIYRVGDTVQGGQIKEIRRGRIVITVNGEDQSLDMSEASKYGQTKSTAPVAAVSPRRRPSTSALPRAEEAAAGQQVKPRVVRPTRRIVGAQRKQTAETMAVEPEEMNEGETIDTDRETAESAE